MISSSIMAYGTHSYLDINIHDLSLVKCDGAIYVIWIHHRQHN